MFERVINFKAYHPPQTMLNEQYRMHTQIMEWSSAAMYRGELRAATSVAGRLMSDLYPD